MSSATIPGRTDVALRSVMLFFGIDDYNRSLFGEAARDAGVESFSPVVEALAAAVERDSRNGCALRIRERIERQRELDGTHPVAVNNKSRGARC